MTKKRIKIIVIMILGILIGSSISVYATYNYFARDIGYKKADGIEVSVEQALNELYNKNIINSELVASGIHGASPDNPNVIINYIFEENGLAIVNLGTRSAGTSAGTTSYYIKIDDEVVINYSGSLWGYLKSWSVKIKKGQKIQVFVKDEAKNAAAFAFINLVK